MRDGLLDAIFEWAEKTASIDDQVRSRTGKTEEIR